MKRIVWLLVCALSVAAHADAADRTVCRSGCQYTSLQTAINEAAPGDTILLRAGETFAGNFLLKAKSAAATAFITIRSDAPDTAFPAPGIRLVPPGKSGANVAAGALPRLVGLGGTLKSTPVVRTEPGAHHYRLQFLEIDGTGNVGYETLVQLGENTSDQTSVSGSPHDFTIDRLYLHGHRTKGMKRGIALDCRNAIVIDSYISDIKSLSDSQAIAVFNGAGPFTIVNNYLEAAGENILFGGADPKTANLVPSDIEIRGNYILKPLAWRNPVLAPPPSVSASARTSGNLGAGTQYFQVVAVMATGGAYLFSAPSTEMAVTTSAGGSVALSWPAVSGADSYRVYRGSSSGGESVFMDATGPSLTYTGSGEKAGTPKSSGTRWTAKNLIEFKNGQRATIDGNIFENNWDGFQQGYGIVFTPRNQENTAPWSAVRDITFTNNRVRNVASALNILGTDDIHPSQHAQNFTIRNNVFEITTKMGGKGYFITMTSGPSDITIDHNTIDSDGTIVNIGGPAVNDFVFTHNLSRHNTYGIMGQGYGIGNSTLAHYFPGSVFTGNVLAGGKAANYPAGNFFPTVAAFDAAFVDAASGDYTLKSGADLGGAPLTVGVAMSTLTAALDSVIDGQSTGTPPDTGGDPGDDTGGTDPGAGTLPEGWESRDIGLVGPTGAASASGSSFTVSGSGADIWGTADAFHFAWQPLTGDGVIVARVTSITGTEAWTKAGVMIRGGDGAGSAHAAMFVSTGKGLAFQRRTANGGVSTHTSGGAGVAPRWVRLARAGNVITASVSTDGKAWTTVDSDTIALPADALVGLAVTSHEVTELASATFDNVTVSAGQTLPAGWSSDDVGAAGVSGSGAAAAGVFTVKGAGADVWGTADAFQFTHTTLDGDGDIVARVASVSGTQAWTKAGVMMRTTLEAGAQHAFMLVSAGKGAAFQRRISAGGLTTNTSGGAVTAPRWVKLSRRGSTITASISADGVAWTVVGSDTFGVSGPMLVGLAVTNHDAAHLATGTFESVSVASVP
jgi:regulation of enolase protein 1 (concanavalin A-like superfamily)